MTYRTRVRSLLAANILLAATLTVGLLLSGRPSSVDAPLIGLESGNAAVIRFEEHGHVLERVGEGWEIVVDGGRYPARSDRIDAFLAELAAARVVRRVTDDPGLYGELEVDDARGRAIVVESGGATSTVVFGSREEPGGGIYARRAGEPTVVVVRAALDFYLDQKASYWAYLRVYPESARPADVVRVFVSLSGRAPQTDDPVSYELVRRPEGDGESWVFADGGATPEPGAVRAVTASLVDLVGSGFFDGAWNALSTVATISCSLADGREFFLEVRDAGDAYVARAWGPALPGESYGGLLYTIEEPVLRRVAPARRDLFSGE